jgi:hypothetical protein
MVGDTLGWGPQQACPSLNYTAKTLGAQAANNDMNSGLCLAAMV